MDNLLFGEDLGKPVRCSECKGTDLEYIGLGGYRCKECDHVMYDDYGKVREYLDAHKGATAAEVSAATGVPSGKIRQMVREERFEVTADSMVFLTCDKCGTPIRSGRFCAACASLRDVSIASAMKDTRTTSIRGFGSISRETNGERRFKRN